MSAKEHFRQLYRSAGSYEGGLLASVAEGSGSTDTADRAHNRDQVPLNPSDSTCAGDQNFLLLSGLGIPAPAGYWPFIL